MSKDYPCCACNKLTKYTFQVFDHKFAICDYVCQKYYLMKSYLDWSPQMLEMCVARYKHDTLIDEKRHLRMCMNKKTVLDVAHIISDMVFGECKTCFGGYKKYNFRCVECTPSHKCMRIGCKNKPLENMRTCRECIDAFYNFADPPCIRCLSLKTYRPSDVTLEGIYLRDAAEFKTQDTMHSFLCNGCYNGLIILMERKLNKQLVTSLSSNKQIYDNILVDVSLDPLEPEHLPNLEDLESDDFNPEHPVIDLHALEALNQEELNQEELNQENQDPHLDLRNLENPTLENQENPDQLLAEMMLEYLSILNQG